MKACIFTGHPAWKNGLNETTQEFWDNAMASMPEITDYMYLVSLQTKWMNY